MKRVVRDRRAALIAVGAAYSFVVMMFNVPIPDGTTAHAVGAVLIAVVLGWEAAVIAVSTALAIQALFFGDGGVLAYGANAFNMAFVMVFVGYGLYRLAAGRSDATSRRRALAAGIGAYAGINAAALMTAIEFGIQPALFHSANGTPLYAPFPLAQTIPAMALAHLTIAGGVEAALTYGIIRFLQRTQPQLISRTAAVARSSHPWSARNIALVFGIVAFLTPLGLIAPGAAFGEDARGGRWHAVLDGYDFSNGAHPTVGYVASALTGLALIALLVGGSAWIFTRVRRRPVRT